MISEQIHPTKYYLNINKKYPYCEIRIGWLYFELCQNLDAIGQFQRLVQHVLTFHIALGNSEDVIIAQFLRYSV